MPVATLTYETPQFLHKLIGNDLGSFRLVGETFGVNVTSREGWVRLEGEDAQIASAREVFMQLEKVRRQGGEISTGMVRLVTESVQRESGDAPAEAIMHLKLQGSFKRPPVLAKTRSQIAYVQAMRECEVVFGVGPAGTGKTYLAVACAVDALERASVQRIVLTRPAVEAGERLGFLPGDLSQKVDPYLRPLYDALYDLMGHDKVQKAFERNAIEIAPLAFMRGRTLNNAFVILDEAQNTSTEQMKMFLTRIGFGAKAVVTGDVSQIDLPKGQLSGLIDAERVLKRVKGIAFTRFSSADVVRHPLVARIVDAYEAQGSAPMRAGVSTRRKTLDNDD